MALENPETTARAIDLFSELADSLDEEILIPQFARLLTADEPFVREHTSRIWAACFGPTRYAFRAAVRSLDPMDAEVIVTILGPKIGADDTDSLGL